MAKIKNNRVLLVTQYFYPENFKANDMAFELAKRGYDVTVLTAIPNYPQGRFFDGYGLLKKRNEVLNGVKVIRTLLFPRRNGATKWMVLNYISFTFFSSLKALRLGITKKYDVILVHEPSPILIGIPAIIVKKIQKIPLHFWVLDLWPESLTAAGGIKNRNVLSFFNRLTKWIYRNSDTLMIGSKGFRQSIESKGNFSSKIDYFPNWVEDAFISPETGLKIPTIPEGFNIMIAGNMGESQDLPHIMETAKLLRGTNINFVFIGDGRKKTFVEEFSRKNGLENQIYCLGKFPPKYMPVFFNKADILFFALRKSPIFSLTVPSRLQAYMSSGKPIVAMIDGEGADLIKEAECGWSVPAEEPNELASLLSSLSKMNPEILMEKGKNGKIYSQNYFQFSKCMDHLENIMYRFENQ